MTLTELIPLLKPYKAVLVTGPQRSGTAIATKMLAQELGYREVPEEEFEIHNTLKALAILLRESVVLHAPALCHQADVLGDMSDSAVVMMRRNLDDIHASEERIGWRTAFGGANLISEQNKYLNEFGEMDDDMAALKYRMWDKYQRLRCDAFDLDYESLRSHPLWKDERKEFAARQTE
jgi:hypothetical protein